MSDIAKDSSAENVEETQVKIHFRTPRNSSVYATHFFIQETPDEIILSFFEVVHPILPTENQEDVVKELRENGVAAECVSRITVAKHKFPSMAMAMQATSERMLANFAKLEEELKQKNADDRPDNSKAT